GHTVYLHCTAGIGRAPTVAIGYLHACLGWELDEAIAHVKQARQCAPHLEALRLSLADQGVLKPCDNGG
ncbi:MAG TPA: dual specificity protein phosphatase family protein, partial [Rugosimonospora sp.]|nr:dual specificity protein phosphatase family protein [Rugosimonospora sp.]